MRETLTVERVFSQLDYCRESGVFRWKVTAGPKKRGAVAGSIDRKGYWVIRLDGAIYRAHRLVWFVEHGRWPRRHLDHVDGARNNNRITNLREATDTENLGNMRAHKDNRSGYKGVSFRSDTKKWAARIQCAKKDFYLGTFDNPVVAARAYDAAARQHFGEYARVNGV